jgi:DNA polymerase-3 subunit alpha
MAALMTSDYDDTDRLAIEISECQHMGIKVLPPDVNESFLEFSVLPDAGDPDNRKAPISFGMSAIKNVGTGAVEEILRGRSEGPFEDLEDLLGKVSTRIVNRKALESLIKAGALDRFADRSTLLHNLDVILAFGSRLQKEQSSGQTDLFGNQTEVVTRAQLSLDAPTTQYDNHEQLVWERELLGLYLSQHPLELFEKFLEEQTIPLNTLKPEHDGKAVAIGGASVDVREIMTRTGQKMAFVKLEDRFGEVEVILFPNSFQQTLGLWERDKVVLIRGKVSSKDREGNPGQEVKVLVDDAREITTAQATAYQATGKKKKTPAVNKKVAAKVAKKTGEEAILADPRLYIRLTTSENEQILRSLKQTLDGNLGETEVVLVLGEADNKQVVKLPDRVDSNDVVLSNLRELVGAENVKLH